MARPALIVVTGPPATGKTTVARELARRLRVPIVGKDLLMERLYESIGSEEELEHRLEDAALAILFAVVGAAVDAGVSIVAESNFDAESDQKPFRRLDREHELQIVQIHCWREEHELLRSFAHRAESGRRHPGHGDEPEDVGDVRAKLRAGLWDPLDLDGELIEYEHEDDEEELERLVARVRALIR